MRCRRRPTLPRPLGRSTIGAVGLNDRVRDGNGCGPYALVASDFQAYCGSARTEVSETLVHAQEMESGGQRMVITWKLDRVGTACRAIRCKAYSAVIYSKLEVVKPHGRLGPLRSESIA